MGRFRGKFIGFSRNLCSRCQGDSGGFSEDSEEVKILENPKIPRNLLVNPREQISEVDLQSSLKLPIKSPKASQILRKLHFYIKSSCSMANTKNKRTNERFLITQKGGEKYVEWEVQKVGDEFRNKRPEGSRMKRYIS
jgi:hypothetical protein